MQYPNAQAQAPVYAQQQIIMINQQSKKSPALAFVLTFFFGPLGLFYASITGGIVMLLLEIPVLFLTFGLGLFFTNIICVVWAMIAVKNYNNKISQPAQFHQMVPPQPVYNHQPAYTQHAGFPQQPAQQTPPPQTPQTQQHWQPYMPPTQQNTPTSVETPAQEAWKPYVPETPAAPESATQQGWKPYVPTPPAPEQTQQQAWQTPYSAQAGAERPAQRHAKSLLNQQNLLIGIGGAVLLVLLIAVAGFAFGGSDNKTKDANVEVGFSGKTTPKTGFVQTELGSNLRLRTAPSESAAIVCNLPNGARVTVIGFDTNFQVVKGESGKWCQVQYGNKTGWVWGKYVKIK